LADFKEELLGNLNAKIESLVKKGMDTQAAFIKASAELGDVSALADELSLKKRKEVFEEVYMDIRNFMNVKRVVGYVTFGVLALFGIIVGSIVFLTARGMQSAFGSILPFLTAAVAGFTWLGVTQETASMYPLSKKRAAWYAAGAGLIAFGVLTVLIVFFSRIPMVSGEIVVLENDAVRHIVGALPMVSGEIVVLENGDILEALTDEKNLTWRVGVLNTLGAFSVLIPFVLPGIGMLAFLVLTEKDRLKPWAKDSRDKAVKREMEVWNDPVTASRFGMFSGAIWIFAFGLFMLLGFVISFKYSWLIFIFAVAFQLLVQGVMSKPKNI
ncbi:MAG: permease prefix domain 1-containing protein, partial [Treponema sp.]|nr:permease prefix domain 1-containing protein [Treponema sp.]